jgi:hypothetical protein
MNVRLDWHSDFLGICAYDDRIYPNHFKVDLHLVTKSENSRHQNIAFERMKVIVNELFAHSIFVGHGNPCLSKLMEIYPEKLVVLPEEAYDQIIGLALFCKLNAVMENVMACVKVRISSKFGEDVWYEYEQGDEMGPFAKGVKIKGKRRNRMPWWNRNDLMTFDATGDLKVSTWQDLDLDWSAKDPETELELECQPDRPAEVIDMRSGRKARGKKFNAEVVNGGKNTDDD